MKSYQQYCGLAKALDVIGDRWTLLIVRELLLRGRCRYSDLKDGLPGIATNLLATRLRELEHGGIVSKEETPPPVSATVYQLTSRGKELEPVLHQIGRWGGSLVARRAKSDTFRPHWMALPIQLHLKDRAPSRPPIAIEVHAGDSPIVIETESGSVKVREGSAENPDLTLSGAPEVVVGVLTGKIAVGEARRAGLHHEGDLRVLNRVLPKRI